MTIGNILIIFYLTLNFYLNLYHVNSLIAICSIGKKYSASPPSYSGLGIGLREEIINTFQYFVSRVLHLISFVILGFVDIYHALLRTRLLKNLFILLLS